MEKFKIPPLVPELLVQNYERSLSFYQTMIGFRLEYARPESKFAMISLEGSWLMLEQTAALNAVTNEEFIEQREWRTGDMTYPFGRGINFQFIVRDVDALYRRLKELNYPIKVPLEERWYRADTQQIGVWQFLVMDPDGYLLRFQQDIGLKAVDAV